MSRFVVKKTPYDLVRHAKVICNIMYIIENRPQTSRNRSFAFFCQLIADKANERWVSYERICAERHEFTNLTGCFEHASIRRCGCGCVRSRNGLWTRALYINPNSLRPLLQRPITSRSAIET
jgi:hypothetical protein